MTSERSLPLIRLLGAFALILSACAEGGAPPPSESGSAGAAGEVGSADAGDPIVEIALDEYWIGMPSTLLSGRTELRLANQGFEEHNLLFVVVESDSTVWETERRLGPGERRTVTLSFEPGAYRAVCDFSGHEGRGMFVGFVVRGTPQGNGETDP